MDKFIGSGYITITTSKQIHIVTNGVQRRLLLIEDNETLRESLVEQLVLLENYHVDEAQSAQEARAKLAENSYDAILMDIGLPDMDGRDLCKLLRKNGVVCPIIILTGADSEADTILGLNSGANDYITKPFHLGVLMARLEAHLRQFDQTSQIDITLSENYRLQVLERILRHVESGEKIRLTDKETAILKYLHQAGEEVVNREELLHDVWGYHHSVSTHTLETHIYRLRQKIAHLHDEAQKKDPLVVTRSGGYALNRSL